MFDEGECLMSDNDAGGVDRTMPTSVPDSTQGQYMMLSRLLEQGGQLVGELRAVSVRVNDLHLDLRNVQHANANTEQKVLSLHIELTNLKDLLKREQLVLNERIAILEVPIAEYQKVRTGVKIILVILGGIGGIAAAILSGATDFLQFKSLPWWK